MFSIESGPCRTIKREIREEFDVDFDRKKGSKKEPHRVIKEAKAPPAMGRVTQVMPSARKAFMESMERKGVVVGKQGSNSIA